MNIKNNLIYSIIVAITGCLFIFSCGVINAQQLPEDTNPASQLDDILSIGTALRVNDDAVTSTQILKTIEKLSTDWPKDLNQAQYLQKLYPVIGEVVMVEIYDLLLYQYAKKTLKELEVPDEAIDKIFNDRKKELLADYGGSEARARNQLKIQGQSLQEIFDQERRQIIIGGFRDMFFTPSLTIIRSHMLKYYRDHLTEEFKVLPSIQFQLIDIQKAKFDSDALAQQNAKEALEKLNSGTDFSQVVKEYSHGFRKTYEGLWQPYNPADIAPTYQPIVKALENKGLGEYTDIIDTPKHLFIARLVDMKEAKTISFEDAQETIKMAIRQEKWQKYQKEINVELMQKSSIGNVDDFIRTTAQTAYLNYLSVNSKAD